MKYAIAIVFVMMLGACKQGEGQRCQVTDDCKSGLTCNQSTMTCQGGTSSMFDAEVPVDAPKTVDAPMTDAPMTDAPAHD